MFPVQCEELRINHLNSTSWSDTSCPTLVSSCSRRSISRTPSDIFIFNSGLRFEGLFWARYIVKGWITYEGHSKTSILNTAWEVRSYTILMPSLPGQAGGQQIILAPNAWEGKAEAGAAAAAAATLGLPLQASPLDPTIVAIPGPNPPTGHKGIPLK